MVRVCRIDSSDNSDSQTVLMGNIHLAHQMTDVESLDDILVTKCDHVAVR